MTVQQDARFLASLLRRLLWLRLLVRAVVLVITLWVSVWLAQWVLSFGAKIRYDGLETLGAQVVAVLTRINPYMWWAVVVVGALIIISILRSAYRHSVAAGKSTIVSIADTRLIVSRVSNPTLDVMQWVWDADRAPLTVGDIQRTINLVRSGKAAQLKLARAQAQLIAEALAGAHSAENTSPTPTDPAIKSGSPVQSGLHIEPSLKG